MSPSRRDLLLGSPGVLAAGAQKALPLAICSETFQGMTFRESCRAARDCGYDGIEVEPAHLSEDPAGLSADVRAQTRRQIGDAGLRFVGLHSFLKAPAGLHLTTPDRPTRERSWQHFVRMIELCADLGSGSVMVFGSGKQRSAVNGMTPSDAASILADGLARIAPEAANRGVTVLLEPLAPHLCNVVTTLAEAITIAKEIDSPGLKSMLDTHNTAGEKLPGPQLVRKYLPWIRHVHLNEMDGRHPGAGTYDFRSLLSELKATRYKGWLSVEVFDFRPDGETVARRSARFIRDLETGLS